MLENVEVTRRPSRATDLKAAFLLYTAPMGLTHMRFCPLASLFEIHVPGFRILIDLMRIRIRIRIQHFL